MGGGQSRDIFRGGPVKKITLYVIPSKKSSVVWSKCAQSECEGDVGTPYLVTLTAATSTSERTVGGSFQCNKELCFSSGCEA